MPETYKLELVGYEGETTEHGGRGLTAEVKKYLEEKATEAQRNIRLVKCDGERIYLRRSDDQDVSDDTLVFYDFAHAGDKEGAPIDTNTIYQKIEGGARGRYYDHYYLEYVPFMTAGQAEESPIMGKIWSFGEPTHQGAHASPMGSYANGTIWFAAPLVNFRTKKILKMMLDPVFKNIVSEEFWGDKLKITLDEVRENLKQHMASALKAELEDAKATVEENEAQMIAYFNNTITLQRNIDQAKLRINFLTEHEASEVEMLEQQLKELLANERVVHMMWNKNAEGGSLDVMTDDIYLFSPDMKERSLLGQFKIQMFRNGSVRTINLTNPKGGYMHPHVGGHGNPCWGGAQQSISKLAASGEIAALFDVVVNYLEQYNPGDRVNALNAEPWLAPELVEQLVEGKWMNAEQAKAYFADKEKNSAEAKAKRSAAAKKAAETRRKNKEKAEAEKNKPELEGEAQVGREELMVAERDVR